MKKILIISLILFTVFACKKTEFSPEGPTDVRVKNLSDLTFNEVIVTTSENSEDTDTLGTIGPGEISEYFRFEKAHPKAEISAKIDGITFSTGPEVFTYMQYIGQDRITYEVYISSMENRELKIDNVVIEEPLVLK